MMEMINNDLPVDTLYYDFNEYLILDNEHYQIDNINQLMFSCEPQLSVKLMELFYSKR